NVSVIKVTLDNGEIVKCTPEHRWLMRDGTYKEAKDLEPNDSLMPFYNEYTYLIESIEYCDEKIDVGDIEVDKYNNFALESGVIIHNSTISTFEDIYIPQKDGKPYVDIETMDQGNVDIRSKVDELQFLRGSVVASLGVPNAFLNLEEELCLFSGTYIPMLDGGSLTLDKIIEEYQNGNYNMWTYSYDHETGKIAPGRIVWANYTRLQTQLVRVHLDNGEYVDCTPDHPFMLRDGSYKEAQYLQSDESLMPFILEEESNDHKNAVKIEWLEGKYDTCDITVEGFHNFPVKAGVMVHNSNKCLDLSSKIPLTDGTKPRLIDLINEYELNGELKDRYVYSYDNETGRIVPGKISWAGRTRMNTEVVRVTFDNGETQIATPDHKFMLRDGSYKEAQYLQEGESLMPFYSKLSHIKTTIKKVPYLSIYHPGLDTWELAHRSFAKHLGIVNDGDGLNVHHEDFNPLNNNPSNLQGLTDSDHVKIHIDHKHFLTTGRGKVKIENYVIENCSVCGEEYVRHIGNNQITCLKEECKKERSRLDGYKSWEKRKHNYSGSITLNCPYCGKSFTRRKKYIEQLSSGIATCGDKECKRQSTKDNVNDPSMKKVLSEAGKKGGNKSKEKLVEYNREHGAPMKGRTKQTHPETFEKRINSLKNNNPENSIIKNNHKVSKVELLSERYDTGDITVDVYHNFAINGGVIVSNSVLSEENVLFARTIVNHQKYLNPQIVDLFEKILNLHDPEEGLLALQTTDISLPSPRSLQYERESRYIGEIVTLIENLERIGIPKEYAKKKYLPQIDWNEVENWESHENIEKNISSDEEEEEDEFGGGGTF
ncbi:MAG: hypothetical protein K9L74_07745, partial [Candidatus Izimaplasma sp.]|nr:hypothetical protein [Candidatus Izimaplasma bacterium]